MFATRCRKIDDPRRCDIWCEPLTGRAETNREDVAFQSLITAPPLTRSLSETGQQASVDGRFDSFESFDRPSPSAGVWQLLLVLVAQQAVFLHV